MASISARVNTLPQGFDGVLIRIARVFGVTARFSASYVQLPGAGRQRLRHRLDAQAQHPCLRGSRRTARTAGSRLPDRTAPGTPHRARLSRRRSQTPACPDRLFTPRYTIPGLRLIACRSDAMPSSGCICCGRLRSPGWPHRAPARGSSVSQTPCARFTPPTRSHSTVIERISDWTR